MNETKWLTVDEASLLCTQMGLNRTKKTIRSWARNDHVRSRKQTAQHGEMWVLEKKELVSKIKAELEFAEQHKQGQTGSDPFAAQNKAQNDRASHTVQTGANPSEPVRTRSNQYEPVHADPGSATISSDGQSKLPNSADDRETIKSLKSKITELSIDVKWRSHALDKLSRENEDMLENMHGQARYIGHLESDLLRLGGKPNQQFLAAPTVKQETTNDNLDVAITKPHPDQQGLYAG